MKQLYIVGAGGFGRELRSWVLQHPAYGREWSFVGFLDDDPDALRDHGRFARVDSLSGHHASADRVYLCGFGDPEMKSRLLGPLLKSGAEFPPFIHPSAVIGERVSLGQGVIICPGAILTCDIALGDFVTINLSATIGHDVSLGAWTTVSSQCDVTGFAKVGERVFIGSKATILPGRKIGDATLVGAGSVVFRDFPPGVTVVGNPAAIIGERRAKNPE